MPLSALSHAAGIAFCWATLVTFASPGAASDAGGPSPTSSAFPTSADSQSWSAPDANLLPDDARGRQVRYGRDLIAETAPLIGPEVPDPSRRFAGNNLNCQNCHLEAGGKQFGIPFQGVTADFPKYGARSGQVGTIQDRVQGCMTRSMNGRPLPPDGPEMKAIVAYLEFMSIGRQKGVPISGRGAGRMPELARAADPSRGQAIFAEVCAKCHGADGQGLRRGVVGDAQGYAFPPLWGPDSFNDGAGMGRLIAAANIIRSNMPFGTTWDHPTLSSEDAWDVAAFVESQPRPHKAQLERDFPNRLEKPVDASYGPYADDFSPQQHRFGPFAPIRDAIKALKANGNPGRSTTPQSP